MIFYDFKKNHKKTAFFCHKFMVTFYDKFMPKKSIKLCKKHKYFYDLIENQEKKRIFCH